MSEDIWNQLKQMQQEFKPKMYVTCELMQALIDEHNAVVKERDELMTHLERIKKAETKRYPQENFCAVDWIKAVRNSINAAPTTSLTRRDLIKQAEGAEIVRDRFREKANIACSQARHLDSAFYHRCANVADNKADELRQQAKELKSD